MPKLITLNGKEVDFDRYGNSSRHSSYYTSRKPTLSERFQELSLMESESYEASESTEGNDSNGITDDKCGLTVTVAAKAIDETEKDKKLRERMMRFSNAEPIRRVTKVNLKQVSNGDRIDESEEDNIFFCENKALQS